MVGCPSLPASVEGFAKKVKPLYRLTEREIAAYAVLNRIDYIVEECPMAKGSKMLLYKDVLNRLEAESPGTKQAFYWGFLERQTHTSQSSGTTIRKKAPSFSPVSSVFARLGERLERITAATSAKIVTNRFMKSSFLT